jgi:hypothetical protein
MSSVALLSSVINASRQRLFGHVAETVPELPWAEEEELQPGEADKSMWENMIKPPDLTQASAVDSSSASASGNSDDDEEDLEMEANDVIGDETMMKSMDMTIVSPGSLYSRMDIHSSLANGGKENSQAQQQAMKLDSMAQLSGRSNQKSASQEQAQPSVQHSGQQQSSPLSSSPHVHFSSPLHASPLVFSSSDRPSNINNRRQSQQTSEHKGEPVSKPDRKSQSQSPRSAFAGNIMEESRVAAHLPTPESDERPSQDVNDDIDDFEDEANDEAAIDAASEDAIEPEARPARDNSQVTQPLTFSEFSSSSSRPSIDEINQQREEQWQLEREEVRRQAVAADRKAVTIESDDEDEDMSDDDGDMWQEAANHSSNSLEDSRVAQRPSAAVYKESQRKNIISQPNGTTSITQAHTSAFGKQPKFNARVSSSDQSIVGPPRDEIAALFKAVSTSSSQPRTGLEQQEEVEGDMTALQEDPSSPMSNEDTSHYLRRKISNMRDEVDFSLDSQNPTQPSVQSEPPSAVPSKSPDVSKPMLTAAVDRRLGALTYSPKRSSPLKRPLNMDESSSSSSGSSPTSHSQQLEHDAQSSKRTKLSTTIESSSSQKVRRPVAKRPGKSLLKVSQERRARTLFGPSYDPSMSLDNSVNNESVSSVNSSYADAKSQFSSPGVSSIASQIWAFVPKFNVKVDDPKPKVEEACPPVHPSHPLLKNFLMLPRMHPWTNDHYTALRCLFLHWMGHVHHFDPALPHNAALLTAEWKEYIGMQFANWGYDCQITESLVVLAAVFAQLLVLRDEAQYEELYGQKMVHGFASEQTKWWGAITEWNVVLRLFTVLVGHRVREDEAIGIPIDRTPALKWKFNGGWIWRRGWFAGLL